MREPLVHIIIVTWNQFDFVGPCIKSILKGNYKNVKIIVVDNNSEQDKFDYFNKIYSQHKNITLYRLNENIGFAGACNYGLRFVKEGYVVFLNNDTIVTKNWLSPIIDYMKRHPDVGACQPKIKSLRSRDYFEYAGAAGGWMDVYGFPFARGRIFFTYEKDEGQYDTVADLVWCSGCCFVTRVDLLKRVGIFDDIFFAYGEEADLSWRMYFYGYRLVYIPSSVIYHYGSGTMDIVPYKKIFLHHRNGLILLLKNYTARELLKYLPARFFFDFLAFWFYIFKSRIFFNAMAVVFAYIDLFRLLPEILKRREIAAFKKNRNEHPYPLYKRSIVIDYYLFRKKKFSELELSL